MPTGDTHRILTRFFNERPDHRNDDLKFLIRDKLKCFQLGALALICPIRKFPEFGTVRRIQIDSRKFIAEWGVASVWTT